MRTPFSHIGPILTAALALYAVATGIFLIAENRRPQAAKSAGESANVVCRAGDT
jgi:hypothetical protein